MNLFQNNHFNFFCLYFFVTPVEIQCSSLKIKPSFAFPPHPFAYFLISGYLLRTPDNSNSFSISLEGSSYRDSTVHIFGFSCGLARSRFICVKKKEIVSGRKVTRLPRLPLACVASVSVRFRSKVRGTRVGGRAKMALLPLFAPTESLAPQASSAEILVLGPRPTR